MSGDIYAADFYGQRIQHLRADGSFVRQWGTTGHTGVAAGRFNYPSGVALARDGSLVVADGYNDRIQVFAADGRYVRKWGGPFALDIHSSFSGCFATVAVDAGATSSLPISTTTESRNLIASAGFSTLSGEREVAAVRCGIPMASPWPKMARSSSVISEPPGSGLAGAAMSARSELAEEAAEARCAATGGGLQRTE